MNPVLENIGKRGQSYPFTHRATPSREKPRRIQRRRSLRRFGSRCQVLNGDNGRAEAFHGNRRLRGVIERLRRTRERVTTRPVVYRSVPNYLLVGEWTYGDGDLPRDSRMSRIVTAPRTAQAAMKQNPTGYPWRSMRIPAIAVPAPAPP